MALQGASALRVLAPDAPEAWCEANEIMVSAICLGGASTSPLAAYSNGAKCGYGDSPARARIVCLPQGSVEPGTGQTQSSLTGQGQQPAATAAAGQDAAGVLRVVSEGPTAQCQPGEALVSAVCTGSWRDYPLQTYPGERVKCGYGSDAAQATAVCMAKPVEAASGQGGPQGLRLVSGAKAAWCEPGETVLSAFCTGTGGQYPLQTYPNGAKCGYGDSTAKTTVLCSASGGKAGAGGETTAPAAAGLRVISGVTSGQCESNEQLISAYCTGGWDTYPLLTYPGGAAKCGYSGGSSQVTMVCMAR